MTGNDLNDYVALVTGASTGLGRAISVVLASRGAAAVIINYRSSVSEAEETAQLVERHGARAVLAPGDVGDDSDCADIVAQAKPFGRLDVLFNNAGVTTFSANHGDLAAVSADDFMQIYRVNVVGAYQMIRAARNLLEQAGESAAVVNTASLAGVAGIGSSLPYACSKGALTTMTLSLARSLAPKIRVNAICPGFIDTPWYSKGLSEEARERNRERVIQSVPLAKASTAEDIAGAAVFLGSPAARHITGETLLVDAGMHLNFTSLGMR